MMHFFLCLTHESKLMYSSHCSILICSILITLVMTQEIERVLLSCENSQRSDTIDQSESNIIWGKLALSCLFFFFEYLGIPFPEALPNFFCPFSKSS